MFSLGKSVRFMSATAALLVLSACGGEPSDGDVKAAIDKQIQEETNAMKQFGGSAGAAMFKAMIPEIKDAKKVGCKQDGEKAYQCDVEIEIAQGGSTNKRVVPVRLVKGSDGWIVTK